MLNERLKMEVEGEIYKTLIPLFPYILQIQILRLFYITAWLSKNRTKEQLSKEYSDLRSIKYLIEDLTQRKIEKLVFMDVHINHDYDLLYVNASGASLGSELIRYNPRNRNKQIYLKVQDSSKFKLSDIDFNYLLDDNVTIYVDYCFSDTYSKHQCKYQLNTKIKSTYQYGKCKVVVLDRK